MKLTGTFKLEQILSSNNLAEEMSEEDLTSLGNEVIRNYDEDKLSRADWEKRTQDAMKLALQVVETKSFPWSGASNVKFPLITIAALQYHARSYPLLITGPNLVKMKYSGNEGDQDYAKAQRVERHMSWQLTEEDEDWENETDLVLITQPIVGCAFKKSYYDSDKEHNISENILAKDLVVSYYTKSLDAAPRISHVIYLSKNDIYTRVTNGSYRDVDLSYARLGTQDGLTQAQNKAQGTNPRSEDEDRPYEIIEQHCYYDLDGDGYEEPYIIVVDRETKQVLRVVARFFASSVKFASGSDTKVLSIKPENYFTKFPFIPSPDGGFYDLGFGSLLGPLNESINTLINQLIDAGTMANTAGGFLGRGIKIRGGNYNFAPLEWKPVDSTGDDLRKNIMPLPVREPSQVLFTLLSLLINYGERIGGSVDILVGQNPGQNTPAETSRTMAEQGMKIFSGIFKRTYRSLKEEYRKLYRLNQLYMFRPSTVGSIKISPEDYQGSVKNIMPGADPNMVTDSQRVMQGNQIAQRANPMLGYNMREVEMMLLRTWKINEDDIMKILPDPKGPNAVKPPVPPKIQEAQMKIQGKMQEVQMKAQIEAAKLEMQAQLNQAKITQLEADALVKLSKADTEDKKVEIAAINAQIGAAKTHQEHLLKTVELLHEMARAKVEDSDNSGAGE